MSYRPSDDYFADFVTSDPATGAATVADSLPTATARRNGSDDATFALTVTSQGDGYYTVTGAVPAGYTAGDVVSVRIAAAVDGVTGRAVIDRFVVESKRISNLNDLSAAAVRSEADAALTAYDGPTNQELDTALGTLQSHGDTSWVTAVTTGLAMEGTVEAHVTASLMNYDPPTHAELTQAFLDAGVTTTRMGYLDVAITSRSDLTTSDVAGAISNLALEANVQSHAAAALAAYGAPTSDEMTQAIAGAQATGVSDAIEPVVQDVLARTLGGLAEPADSWDAQSGDGNLYVAPWSVSPETENYWYSFGQLPNSPRYGWRLSLRYKTNMHPIYQIEIGRLVPAWHPAIDAPVSVGGTLIDHGTSNTKYWANLDLDTESLTWTVPAPGVGCDTLVFLYTQVSGAGSCDVLVNDVSVGTVTTTGASTVYRAQTTIALTTPLALGDTVKLVPAGDGQARISGMYAYDSDGVCEPGDQRWMIGSTVSILTAGQSMETAVAIGPAGVDRDWCGGFFHQGGEGNCTQTTITESVTVDGSPVTIAGYMRGTVAMGRASTITHVTGGAIATMAETYTLGGAQLAYGWTITPTESVDAHPIYVGMLNARYTPTPARYVWTDRDDPVEIYGDGDNVTLSAAATRLTLAGNLADVQPTMILAGNSTPIAEVLVVRDATHRKGYYRATSAYATTDPISGSWRLEMLYGTRLPMVATATAGLGRYGASRTSELLTSADVRSEADAALVAYDPPTHAEIVSAFTEIKGATWSAGTDTLEALRDRGDAAWATAVVSGLSTFDPATDQVIVATNNDKGGYGVAGVVEANVIQINDDATGAAKMQRYWSTLESGTATGGSTANITLNGASSVHNFYIGDVILITGGTGAGQARQVQNYNGSSKVCVVNTNWSTQPDDTSQYLIIPGDWYLSIVAGVQDDTLSADALSADAIAAIQAGLATPESVWSAESRTLTSAGSGGATAQEVWEYASRELSGPTEANLVQINGTAVVLADLRADVSGLATTAQLTGAFTEIKGSTWSGETDSLEAIRDRGDTSWTTAVVPATIDANVTQVAGSPVVGVADFQASGFATSADLETLEGNIRGVDSDTLATLSGQLDAVTLITDKYGSLLAGDGLGGWEFTAAALENAPSGSSGDSVWSTVQRDQVLTELAAVKGQADQLAFAAGGDLLVTLDGETVLVATSSVDAIRDGVAMDADVESHVSAALNSYNVVDLTDLQGELAEIRGATFNPTTDSLEAIRDRGDAGWVTSTLTAAGVWANGSRSLTSFAFPVDLRPDQSGVTVGGIYGISFPANFAALSIDAGGEVAAAVDTSDLATSTEIQNLQSHGDTNWATAVGFSRHSAADVWLNEARTLTDFAFEPSVNIEQIHGAAIPEANPGAIAANFSQFFDVLPTTAKTVEDIGSGGDGDVASVDIDSTGSGLTLGKAVEVIYAILAGRAVYDEEAAVWSVYGTDHVSIVAQITMTAMGDRNPPVVP